MRILLTGASSFTGYWFARELHAARHQVVASLRGSKSDYTAGARAERVKHLAQHAEIVWNAPFGRDAFLSLAKEGRFDLLCQHHARVTDYRSPDFDIARALTENTNSQAQILRSLIKGGLQGVVLTGSVFEAGEGQGSDSARAFSPYGVSKGLTSDVVRFWAKETGVPLGKFVIPNPFGVYEEPRFCAYLIKTWKNGEPAIVKTPDYVRDNIHADLLAKSYANFVAKIPGGPVFVKYNPSGYAETQAAFTRRYAAAVGPRLGLKAEVQLTTQTDFSEPLSRTNTEPVDARALKWSEEAAWDAIAEYYR